MNTIYYVSPFGKGNGLDQNSPMSIEAAQKIVFESGDCLLLKRNEVYKGGFSFKTNIAPNEPRFKLSAYGEGTMPVIDAVAARSDESDFVEILSNIYRVDLRENGEDPFLENNIGFIFDSKGNSYRQAKNGVCELSQELQFCYDGEYLVLYCNENPAKKYGTLYFTKRRNLFQVCSNTEVCDLLFCNCSGHGINKGEKECRNIYIHDCVFENIGGAILYYRQDGMPIRYGNGIEFYNGYSYDIRIENNLFRNIYDVCFTMQGNYGDYSNVRVCNNVFVENNQSSEIWANMEATGVVDYEFSGNISFATGRGWGYTTRPYSAANTEILFYHYNADKLDMKAFNNIYFDPFRLYWWPIQATMPTFKSGVQSYSNHAYIRANTYLINFSDFKGNTNEFSKEFNKEQDTVYTQITVDEAYRELINVARNSYDKNEIKNAAEKNGIKLKIDGGAAK